MSTPFWADQAYTKGLDLTLQVHDFRDSMGWRMLYYSDLEEGGTLAELSADNMTSREEIDPCCVISSTIAVIYHYSKSF